MTGFRRSDDIFREFDRMFREIEKRMHEMMTDMFRPETWNIPSVDDLEGNPNVKTYYWGYRAEIGPDGVPRIETFGNVTPPTMLPMNENAAGDDQVEALPGDTSSERPRLASEPVTDVIVDDQDEVIRVIMELPGVTEKHIKLEPNETTLKVEATSEFKRFYKEITFPRPIDPKSLKKSLKNGILELKFKFKKGNEPKRRFRIRLP